MKTWISGRQNASVCEKLEKKAEYVFHTFLRNIHHVLSFIFRWVHCCDNRHLNKGWLGQNVMLLFEFSFSSSHCFYIKFPVANKCLQPRFLILFERRKELLNGSAVCSERFAVFWTWLLDCWAFARKTLLQLENLKHIFDVDLQQFGLSQEGLLLTNVKLNNFGLLSLCCSRSIELALHYFNSVWMFNFEIFHVTFLNSQFFWQGLLVWVDAFF